MTKDFIFKKEFIEELTARILEETKDCRPMSAGTEIHKSHFAESLGNAAKTYFAAKSAPTNYEIRTEMRSLNALASTAIDPPADYTANRAGKEADRFRRRLSERFEQLRSRVAALSNDSKTSLQKRLALRPSDSLIDLTSLGPTASDETAQHEYPRQIASVTQIGRGLKEGRARPSGKRSRPTAVVALYAPDAIENPHWREAERELEMMLALAWLELTENEPVDSENYRIFIENVFEELGIDNVDISALTKRGRARVAIEKAKRKTCHGPPPRAE